MPFAARIGDMHVCPMVTPGVPPVPHVGGPILLPPGTPTVLISFMPAAGASDMCVCVGPPDVIVLGSMSVMINLKPPPGWATRPPTAARSSSAARPC